MSKITLNDENIMGQWKIHIPHLLQEILNNPGAEILVRPFQLLGLLLYAIGKRAAELNDAELNGLMCRLTIYPDTINARR